MVEALLILNLAIGNLDDIVAHACKCGGALGIGETRGFAVVGGAALAFQNDAHTVGAALDEDVGIAAGFVIQRACGFAERDAHIVGDIDAQAAFVAGERDEHGGLNLKGRSGLSRHAFGGPAELLDAAQACGLLGERGDIRRAEEWWVLPKIGVVALGVDNAFPTAVGRDELKRYCFIKLLLCTFAGLKHCEGAAYFIACHEQLVA